MRCSYPYFDQPQGRPTSNLSFSSLRWTALAWGCSYKAVTVNEFHVSMVIGPDDKILSQCLGSFGGGATCNHGLSQCLDSFGMFFFFWGGSATYNQGLFWIVLGCLGGQLTTIDDIQWGSEWQTRRKWYHFVLWAMTEHIGRVQASHTTGVLLSGFSSNHTSSRYVLYV